MTPPRHASSAAQLRCSQCGHTLTAKSILVDSGQLDGAWEVVEDSGTDNVFASLFQSRSDPDSDSNSLSPDEDGLRDIGGVVVPQSNEWETQPFSIVFEEPLETEAEFQISNNFRSSEVGNLGESVEFESESMPDQMIGVSDEPWFSPISHQRDNRDNEAESPSDINAQEFESHEIKAQEIEAQEIEAQNDVEFQKQIDEIEEDSLDGMLDSKEEQPALDFDSEAALMMDEVDEEGSASKEMFDAEVNESELEELELVEEVDNVISPAPTEVRRRTPQILPNELLGNSSSVLRSRKKGNPVGTLLSVVGGGMAAIPISILLMWYALGKDPLDAGPMVANLVPWIVPERFQGNGASSTETLPEMPPMVGPVFSDADSDGPRKLPAIGDVAAVEPTMEPVAQPDVEPTAETVMKPVVEPGVPTEIAASANALAVAPTLDAPNVSPSVPEMSDLSSIPGLFPPNPPSVEANDIASNVSTHPNVSAIEQAIVKLEKAIQVYDSGAAESAAILFRSLEFFGEQLAAVPESSPERAQWQSKGAEVCQAIIANRDILSRLGTMIDSGNSTEVFPGERIEYKEHLVNIDLVKVSGVEKGPTEDKWQVAMRRHKSLDLRSIIMSHSHVFEREPQTEKGFLVIGESEVDPDTRQPVERCVIAVPFR